MHFLSDLVGYFLLEVEVEEAQVGHSKEHRALRVLHGIPGAHSGATNDDQREEICAVLIKGDDVEVEQHQTTR